jgi:hypothetical protein
MDNQTEFFVTLLYLRQNPTLNLLSGMVDTTGTTIMTYIRHGITSINKAMEKMIRFPQGNEKSSLLKLSQQEQGKDVQHPILIVDCTSVKVPRLGDWDEQKKFYVFFKRHHAFRFLTITTISGYTVYVSQPFNGNQCDQTIFNQLDILKKIVQRKGYSLMADGGFASITSLREQEPHRYFIPYRHSKKMSMPSKRKLYNKQMGKNRCVIETSYARVKSFRTIGGVLNVRNLTSNETVQWANDLFRASVALTNFELTNHPIRSSLQWSLPFISSPPQ